MAPRGKKILSVYISEEVDKELRLKLGEYRKGALSKFVEEAILEKLVQSAERTSSRGVEVEVAEAVAEELKRENRYEVTKQEIDALATSFGAVSTRTRAEVLKHLLRTGVLRPRLVRGNKHVYVFQRLG